MVKYSCYKPGMNQSDFNKDNYECIYQSRTYGSGIIGLTIAQNMADRMYKMCMESKGYTLAQKPAEQAQSQSRSTEFSR